MFKKSHLGMAIAFAMGTPAIASAEVETSVVLKSEVAVFLQDGIRTGEQTNAADTTGDGREFYKSEMSAKIFFNGDIGEESSWHGELNVIYDPLAEPNYKGHRNYTQHDWFRELYVDTTFGEWDARLGKQQVVWGTADGIKLLDIINPTDFREFSQNSMEDSRIPVWMVNVERNIGETGNIQFIASQAEENKVAGLGADSDGGHPFIMKGVDTITGSVNGFLNIAPALAGVATSFHLASSGGFFDVDDNGTGDPQATGLGGFSGLTVDGFASNTQQLNDPTPGSPFSGDESIRAGGSAGVYSAPGGVLLNTIAQTPAAFGLPAANGNNGVTNLVSTTYNPVAPNEAFELMPNATFATFNSFSGATSQYVRDYPKTASGNFGGRFRGSLDNGLNYSFNYFYHYDANPAVDISWHDSVTGEQLTTVLATSGDFNADTAPDFADPTGAAGGTTIAASAVPTTLTLNGFGQVTNATTVLLRNSANQYYGPVTPNPTLAAAANAPVLRFTERLNRVHSIGTLFDYGMDLGGLPIVLRGEFLYDKDSLQPVVDRKALSIGDLTGALKMEQADYFKYVLGADVTVLTNLLVSAQFIQFRNLDYIDSPATCNTQSGAQGSTTNTANCSRYTGDPSTLHLSNGLKKGWENKEFYSLFFSKPFGESQLGRVNNITIYEEGGGFWNRIDAEYSLSDEIILTGEINAYFGNENTTFGQFRHSSNAQVGVKWILE